MKIWYIVVGFFILNLIQRLNNNLVFGDAWLLVDDILAWANGLLFVLLIYAVGKAIYKAIKKK